VSLGLLPDEIIVDSFAGGGGASLGLSWALGRGPDIAINHDAEAIALHQANHPESRHYCEDVWQVDPVEATGGRPVGVMWLSPDCKHFSKAKGAKPVNKKVRGLAWVAVRWAVAVQPRVIVLENVEEFQTWGPIGEDGRPCPRRKGLTFKRFIGRLRNLGYAVEWRELRACDYGAPTIRKRLFLIARRDGQPIRWPSPTHGRHRAHPWRTAAECIDWTIPCPSIFDRAKPLAENTRRRIAAGLRRFVLDAPRPFVVPVDHQSSGAAGARGLGVPLSTITAEARHALVAPYLVPRYGERDGQEPRARSVEQPAPVVVPTQNGGSLVSAFLAKHYGGHETPGGSLADPMSTVTTQDHHHLCTAYISSYYGSKSTEADGRGSDLRAPLPTQPTENRFALVRAFLVAYFGADRSGGSLLDPMRTVTGRDRFGLVTVEGQDYAIVDIGMRMLVPRELFRAQGFPDSYRIEIPFNGKPLSKAAQVRMCGNSVVPQLAEALVRANLGAIPVEPRADQLELMEVA
jgi:DNA (cytosine-5)-methyltransferase 1